MKEQKAKILLFDIETAPNLGYFFNLYQEGNILGIKEHWYILSFAWKWLDEKQTHVLGLPNFSSYKKDKQNDFALVKKLWELFDEADIIIAHNGGPFDIKKSNVQFIKHGLRPPSPYKIVDTKKEAKQHFRFDSNKLDDLGDFLGLGRKLQHNGWELWHGCLNGDKKSWDVMLKYNKQDVVLLEKVYSKLLPWMTNHPNINLLNGTVAACANCGSHRVQKRGYSITRTAKKERYQCQDCGAWSLGKSQSVKDLIIR